MQRAAYALELVSAYLAIGVLTVMAVGTMTPPVGGGFAAAATSGCTPPSFSNLNITAANLYTPWSVPLLSAIEDVSFPKVSATGLPPGITLKDQTTAITTGAGTTLHSWMLDGAPTQLGTYSITVTAQNSCGGASTIITLPINNNVTAQGTVSCPSGFVGTYPNCVSSSGASVSFDKETLVATTSTATITGTSRTSFVSIKVQTSNGVSYTTGTSPVAGGRWAITLNNLKTGTYSLFLYDGSNTLLVPATLTVTVPTSASVPAASTQSSVAQPAMSPSSNSAQASNFFSCSSVPSFKIGNRGSAVLALQKSLIAMGALPSDSATGYFGTGTNAALMRLCPSISKTTVQPVTSLPSCPRIPVPPCTGGTLVSLGADTNHCSLGYVCQQRPGSNCPAVASPQCSNGTLVVSGRDYNGCATGYTCQRLVCPEVTQITCAPGQTIVSAPDANGCPTISYCVGTPTNTVTTAPSSSETPTVGAPSSAAISASVTSGSVPLTVTFNLSTFSFSAPTIYFGDGTSGAMSYASASSFTASHTYSAVGTYSVSANIPGYCAAGFCLQSAASFSGPTISVIKPPPPPPPTTTPSSDSGASSIFYFDNSGIGL